VGDPVGGDDPAKDITIARHIAISSFRSRATSIRYLAGFVAG
jgi:hypothetical protein